MEQINEPSNGKHNVILTLREERGMSQRELAQASGISRGRLRHLENGSFEDVTFGELKRMAEILKTDLRDFLACTAENGFLLPELVKMGEAAFQMELPQAGCRILSHHVPRPDFFSGKLLVGANKLISSKYAPRASSVLIQVVIGKLRVEIREASYEIGEGDSLIFPGDTPYTIENPTLRDCLANLITVPSFLISSLGVVQSAKRPEGQRS